MAMGEPPTPSDADPVAELLARRTRLSDDGDAATRLARAIAYDLALIRLCEQLGVDNPMTGPMAGPVARRETESLLSSRVPKLQRVLERPIDLCEERTYEH